MKYEYYKEKKEIQTLFSGYEAKTKNKICEYIIKKSFLLFFIDLFIDSDLFKPLLTTTTPIESNNYILLRNYLQKYIHDNFKQVITMGTKITYPKDEIASILTGSEIKLLIEDIKFNKTLLQSWEPVILSCYKDSLPHLLDLIQLNTKKRKEPVIELTKKTQLSAGKAILACCMLAASSISVADSETTWFGEVADGDRGHGGVRGYARPAADRWLRLPRRHR